MAKKLVPRSVELVVVGLRHRVTPSTLVLFEKKTDEGPIQVRIEREPENTHDEHAIKVILDEPPYKDLHIGYVPRGTAAVLSGPMDEGKISEAHGFITDVQVEDGTATMLLRFKTPVKVMVPKREQS